MIDHVGRVLSEYFPDCKEELILNGRPLGELVQAHGTPLFVYRTDIAAAHLRRLRSALPDFEVSYSVKANPHIRWLEFFVQKGCGLSVATEGELDLALQAGCPAERIVMAGAGKTEADLIAGVRTQVREIHVESLHEIRTLEGIASRANHQVKAVVRLNAGEIVKLRDGSFVVRNKAAAYGFDEESVGEAIGQIRNSDHLVFQGIHTYYGTQHLDSKALLSAYKHTVDLARGISKLAGAPLGTINFGGGFGVPYHPEEESFDIDKFGFALGPILQELHHQHNLGSTKFCVEPGRYLVGEAGFYVTRVIGTKDSYDKKFVVVDGGIHHHLAAAGRLGGPVRRNFPVVAGNRLADRKREVVSIVGRQCSALDTLARDVALANVVLGDTVVFFQSGAYTLSVSPQAFRSHPNATEIFVE
jgi:diaminopimelate decarboxylase